MEVGELYAVGSQLIDVWRLDLRAVGSEVGKAGVILQDEEYVRALIGTL
jgi:hypothetical protein